MFDRERGCWRDLDDTHVNMAKSVRFKCLSAIDCRGEEKFHSSANRGSEIAAWNECPSSTTLLCRKWDGDHLTW